MSSQEDQATSDTRINIIQTVQTPLGFFVLVVLIVEVAFAITANMIQGLKAHTWS